MAEQQGTLVLVGLEAKTGKLLLRQRLATPQNQLFLDGGRRLQALHISQARGILVCPTNAGAIMAYDLVTDGLLWAHAYRTKPLIHGPRLKGLRSARDLEVESIPNLRSPWQVTAPIIAGTRLLHAAADSPSLECLDLLDGRLIWKADRASDDVYLAGEHLGVVVVVGRKQCRGLRLEDGRELWRCATAMPAGQGLFAKGSYYLPISNRGSPGLIRINVAQGLAQDALPAGLEFVPGNLILAKRMLIAQSATGIYSMAAAKEDKKD
jgi:hypothetical protein